MTTLLRLVEDNEGGCERHCLLLTTRSEKKRFNDFDSCDDSLAGRNSITLHCNTMPR
jgi:hypothetical protein